MFSIPPNLYAQKASDYQGLPTYGRGWVRTSDLSRVKRCCWLREKARNACLMLSFRPLVVNIDSGLFAVFSAGFGTLRGLEVQLNRRAFELVRAGGVTRTTGDIFEG